MEDEENPFRLSQDGELFSMREAERTRKKKEKERMSKVPIWKKTTQSSRLGRTTRVKVSSGKRSSGSGSVISKASSEEQPRHDAHRREMESMSDFISKKREMFLVQMSLDTKAEEIRKLEEKARLKEEALQKSEKMLEEDAIRFQTFLMDNDQKTIDAVSRAESEAKKKQEKLMEIKKLKQQIQMVQTDISKLNETLDLCEEYKKFLNMLTPEEWFEKQEREQRTRREARRKARWKEKTRLWKEKQKAARKQKNASEENEKNADAQDTSSPSSHIVSAAPELEDEPLTESDTEEPMYFTEPEQLLDIFTALEETNLFLIQNSQETEQTLEELKQDYAETKALMESKTTALKGSIAQHQEQISGEEAKTKLLKEKASASGKRDSQDKLMNDIHDRVVTVYEECGFDGSSNPTTLSMLAELEGKLEDLLVAMEGMDPEYVEFAKRAREKDRREKVRLEKQKKEKREYEERLKRAMDRAAAPIEKHRGKKVMYPMRPTRKKKTTKRTASASKLASDARNARYMF